jgi:CRP/FNR family transcriptional regulator, polysaccharide utilization system transcription regulator
MKKIAVIEDNAEMRENIQEILELANYAVVTAENGRIGIDLVKTEKPDLILCDIMMPELDGYGVLYYLSKDPEAAAIPFVFLSAKAEMTDMRKGMTLGADDYITKPFDQVELLDAIEVRLKRSESIKQLADGGRGLDEFVRKTQSLDGLRELALKSRSKFFTRKEQIFFEGDHPTFIYYILEGKVRTYRVNDDGKEFVTELYSEGDYFGYFELLQDKQYTDYASALEDVKVALISKEDFYNVILANREVASSFMKLLANNILDKERELIELAYDTVRKRVANSLVRLYDKYNESDDHRFTMSISRDELASLVGTATESVIRILSEFKTDGWIHVRGSMIEILQIDKLRNFKF